MADKYAHVAGCKCASCKKIQLFRKETGNNSWDHKGGCGCSKCRQVENLREQAELSKRIKASKKS
jgi:hypothetical protein